MSRIAIAGLLGLAMFVVPTAQTRAGSIHYPKKEVMESRIRLYEHELSLYAANPAGFDQKHPVLGSILASEQGYDAFLSDHTFPKLLCSNTPFLWRVVAGDIFYHRLHPWQTTDPPPGTGTGPPLVTPPGDGGSGPPDPGNPGGGGSGPHNPNGPGGGGTVGVNAVPEPSSWAILTCGATLVLLAGIRRRMYERLTGLPGRSGTAKLREG